MANELNPSTSIPSGAETAAAVVSADADALATALALAPAATRTPGQQALAAVNLAQIQAAVGIRRTFSPFAY